MILSDLSRFCHIVRILLRYHLAVLIPLLPIRFPLRIASGLLVFSSYRYRQLPLGERLRLALQALGPVWIKLGQMLSTRRDLLPVEIADQLALLQDRVSPFEGKTARIAIEKMLGGPIEKWFVHFDEQPLACASIAQIHTAYLKDSGREVVIKVIRPEIHALMVADIRLMYLVARCVQRWSTASHRLRPIEVVQEYEKTLLAELNLIREAANAVQLRRNFNESPLLYIPEVFVDHCRDGVMVMERIEGIPVSDITALQANGTNLQLLAERGVQIFFTQVFRDSLFHADMHPGNIFVSRDHPDQPKYIGVDFGIIGSLNRQDKHYLASNFIAFFNCDYRRVAELHVASGWVPHETNIEEFEFAIRGVCEPIFQKPLSEISFSHVLVTLFSTARRFNMIIQPQLLLLQKTLLCVEGLGRQLYPQLDLWTTAKPFLESWMQEQVGWPAMWRTLKEKSPIWLDRLPQLPELLYDTLQQQKHLQHQLIQQQRTQQHRHNRDSTVRCWFAIGTTLLLCGFSLLATGMSYWIHFMVAGGIAWLVGWHYFMV